MTNYSMLKRLTLLAVLGACLLAVSGIQRELNRIKDEQELVIRDKVDDMTPLMAFCTGALGGFRGLIADILFLRLQFLQEKERYFEINELGHLILQLQPDMGEAAAHLGWNMSYNISVKFTSPKDRWRWVRRGIELLRDKAIVYNTTNPVMYHQLGWAYQHKIGQFLDDAHLYYKGQLALQMIEVLGKEKRYNWDRLAAAPNNEDGLKRLLGNRLLKRLLLKDPEATDATLDEALINLAGQVKASGNIDPVWQKALDEYNSLDKVKVVLDRFNSGGRDDMKQVLGRQLILIGANSDFYRILAKKRYILRKLESEFRKTSAERPTGGLPSDFVEPYERLGLTQVLDDYFRSRWLRDVHKIDADFVPVIFERTGYLDFRTPYTHGIYWASVGLKYAPENKKLHRMVQQCLYQSSKWGQLQYVSADGVAVLMPNFDVIDNYFEVFADQPVVTRGDDAGAENFLKDNIVILYSWGEEERAQYWFNYLKTKTTLGKRRAYRKKTLEAFVIDLGSGDIADKSQLQTSSMMMGMAVQYLRALAFDDRDRAERLIVMLRRIHERYYEELKNKRRKERMRIPTVEELIIQAKYYLMQTAPSQGVAQQIWNVGPDLQKIEEERRKNARDNVLDKDENRQLNIQK